MQFCNLFFRYNKGLIYRGEKIINWDPVSQTALSNEEVRVKVIHSNVGGVTESDVTLAKVSGAIIISLVAVIVIQLLLAICHLTYQGGSPYLLLGNINTLFAILVILASSVLTVYWVMKNQLSATPGDLIYDR